MSRKVFISYYDQQKIVEKRRTTEQYHENELRHQQQRRNRRTHGLEREQRLLAASREKRLADEARLDQQRLNLIQCGTIPIINMNEAEVAMNFKYNEEWEGTIVVSRTLDEAAKADLENEFHQRFPTEFLGEDNEEGNAAAGDE